MIKTIGIFLIIIGLSFFFGKRLVWEWQILTAINCGECAGLSDATECLNKKVNRIQSQPWWKAKNIYFPSGAYRISGVISVPSTFLIANSVSFTGYFPDTDTTILKMD